MAKTWVLDTSTKGTGAQMVPLERALEESTSGGRRAPRRKRSARPTAERPTPPAPRSRGEQRLTPLPPGHVRKKATGELGRVQSVDAKAGTATVLWLRQGRASTVPISAISRR
jgi:hypothetical protein